ncbi:unnamed protein product [Rotaria magnacalcarata]
MKVITDSSTILKQIRVVTGVVDNWKTKSRISGDTLPKYDIEKFNNTYNNIQDSLVKISDTNEVNIEELKTELKTLFENLTDTVFEQSKEIIELKNRMLKIEEKSKMMKKSKIIGDLLDPLVKEMHDYFNLLPGRPHQYDDSQLSEAKLELAGRTPLFNYGGQEILIQQLQDEIERLTKKYSELRPKLNDNNGNSNDDGINVTEVLLKQEIEQLKRRLEKTNSRIQILINDKERLLEINEPAIIKRPQIVDVIPTNIRSNIPTSPKKDYVNLENKFQRLEQLQYALTKQELENRKRADQ